MTKTPFMPDWRRPSGKSTGRPIITLLVIMKQRSMLLLSAVVAILALVPANLGRAGDTVPESRAWHTSVKVVYLDLGISSFARLGANSVLSSTLPHVGVSTANQVTIDRGACTATIKDLVGQFETLEPANVEPSIDVRVVFIFTRVDGLSVLLAADSGGQFEWANIKHKLPTLEQRKALWRTLPHEVVAEYPGPLKETK
jgi:hypothetical protein